MSENTPNPFGRSTTHVVPEGHQPDQGEPRFNKSIGTSPRGTVYAGTQDDRRDPGIAAQEITQGNDPNKVRPLDQGGKTYGVHVVDRADILEADGRTPYKGGEISNKHVINIDGVGLVRVQQALSLGLVKPEQLGMPAGAAGEKSPSMKAHEERQAAKEAGKQPDPKSEVDPEAAKVTQALDKEYGEIVSDLDKNLEQVGASSETILDQLAKGETVDLAPTVEKLVGTMGEEAVASAINALELRVIGAVQDALPKGADLDATLDAMETPENARRFSQAYVTYLRSGDRTLLNQMAKEFAQQGSS